MPMRQTESTDAQTPGIRLTSSRLRCRKRQLADAWGREASSRAQGLVRGVRRPCIGERWPRPVDIVGVATESGSDNERDATWACVGPLGLQGVAFQDWPAARPGRWAGPAALPRGPAATKSGVRCGLASDGSACKGSQVHLIAGSRKPRLGAHANSDWLLADELAFATPPQDRIAPRSAAPQSLHDHRGHLTTQGSDISRMSDLASRPIPDVSRSWDRTIRWRLGDVLGARSTSVTSTTRLRGNGAGKRTSERRGWSRRAWPA